MDQPRRIAVLIGSLRADSINRRLALALAGLAPAGVTLQPVALDALPLYNQDDEQQLPAAVQQLKTDIEAADGVLFVTPEYNRSVPGVLKNAIDWASRPYGKSSFAGKPAGVIGTSPGAIGTATAQQHLRTVLAYLDMPTLGQPEAYIQNKDGLFGAGGEITSDSVKQFLQKWMQAYLAWVEKINSGKATTQA